MRHYGKNLVGISIESVELMLTELCRLKVLKDEIRKPYFIALKRFLLEEGVRGVNDTPRSCKVLPPRECLNRFCFILSLRGLDSEGCVCMVKLHSTRPNQSGDSGPRSLFQPGTSSRSAAVRTY